ncbi:extracellular solute-binding protein [Neorhizobium galegae]|uniref:extracellular solute-binding protein n=1 Tax=Neorhizobium galegae TaxID=399 RepID=UPI000622B406|nr:extracellular solute-binding protein [Neorhizobium galegae]KAB1127224.1 extracellular solute-binding protein [Neorhizobium galegae]MCQ1804954.1 extracellular solute-binding protein [Neorhizobium galegae]CDZ55682.1 Glycerol-3-phosphate transporter periplasmic binding protein [Neorhizobium galegae bv. orientalis]
MKISILAAAAALMAGACSAQAANIEFWYGNTGPVETAIKAQCDAFNAAQSQHKVTCVGQGSYEVSMQKAIAAYRAKNHPVLIQFFDAGTLDLMLSNAVVPVQEILPDVKWDSYIAGARAYYETSGGKLFAQPYNASTLLFYTNKTELEKAGITQTPTTWEEVIDAARKLKAAGHACPFVTDGDTWRVLEQFSARHGLPIASRHNGYDGLDAEYVFNTTFVAKHLQNLVDWRKEGLVKLNADTKAGNYTAAFNAGECAMMEGSSGSYAASTKAFDGKYQLTVNMAPMYKGYERHNTLVGGASIYVMKGHDQAQVDGAKAFLDFLRKPEQQMSFTAATGYVPVTNDVLEAINKSGDAKAAKYATAAIGIESMNQPPTADSRGIRLGFYVQFREIFMEETQKAYGGQQTMQVSLDNAKKRGDELLRRFEQTYKGVKLP